MLINSMKNGQVFDISYTAENAGKVHVSIAETVKRIHIQKILSAVPTAGDISADFIGGDFKYGVIGTAGAAGAITSAAKLSSAVSFGSRVIKLNAAAITKTSGLELEFGVAAVPKVGDFVFIEATDPVAKDSNVIRRSLTVIGVTGSKVKLMSEVPSGVVLPTAGDLIITISMGSGIQPVLKKGVDISSTSRNGVLVTLKGSAPKIYGAEESQGMLQIAAGSKLLSSKVRASGATGFQIISSKEGDIVVKDADSLIETKAIGADFVGSVDIVAVNGFTLVTPSTFNNGSPETVLIDMTALTGAAAGDSFKVFAYYGGDI